MDRGSAKDGWTTTEASVISCEHQSAALSSMAFGVSLEQKFRITYAYYAHGRLYSGSFGSPIAIPQNEKISLAYNPLQPEQNSYNAAAGLPSKGIARAPFLAVGITGSVVLSLAWLLLLRGCR